jgi:hypothetical protein
MLNSEVMNCYRYKVHHDYGFAPNPFWGFMTLATCKGQIRRSNSLHVGDWIVGFGSVAMGNLGRMIFAMKVEEIITFDEYWKDVRFECKKPVLNGMLVQLYGDNVYHTDPISGRVIQEKCAHTNEDGSANEKHLNRDSAGKNVLISRTFYYFGDHSVELPREYAYICIPERNVRGDIQYTDLAGEDDKITAFANWLSETYEVGIHGEPCNWKEHGLPNLDESIDYNEE